MYPDGKMTKDGFKKFAAIALPNAPPDADVEYLFRAMDHDKNGNISFQEFLMFQSVTAPTTTPLQQEELIDCMLYIYFFINTLF